MLQPFVWFLGLEGVLGWLLFGSLAWKKYLVGRTNEWVANPLGLMQASALQILDLLSSPYISLISDHFI